MKVDLTKFNNIKLKDLRDKDIDLTNFKDIELNSFNKEAIDSDIESFKDKFSNIKLRPLDTKELKGFDIELKGFKDIDLKGFDNLELKGFDNLNLDGLDIELEDLDITLEELNVELEPLDEILKPLDTDLDKTLEDLNVEINLNKQLTRTKKDIDNYIKIFGINPDITIKELIKESKTDKTKKLVLRLVERERELKKHIKYMELKEWI